LKIDKSVFKYIEYELYSYQQTKKEIKICRDSIINGSPCIDEIKTKGKISNPTANKANKLVTSAFLNKSERTINAINKSMEILNYNHKRLFELRYVEGLYWKEVYLEMNLSDRSYYRLRRELVMTVGIQLGMLNSEDK